MPCACCNNPACCQHYCNKMCCNQIKWVVPGYTDFFTTVGTNCRAGLIVTELGLEIRVLVRCSGYAYGAGPGTPGGTPYDCDTDCQIIEVEYSEDSGETWTTTPPESAAGITWSVYCDGDAEQPTAEASTQRCAAITSLDAAQCEAADGEPCSRPCQDCGLPCGPPPTEWRLVSGYPYFGEVWFAGDIVENPLYGTTPEPLCTDLCTDGVTPPSSSARFLLQHFPLEYCQKTPAGWPRAEYDIWLILEVCCGGGWHRVAPFCGCYPSGFIVFPFVRDTSQPCWFDLYGPVDNTFQSPPDCSCLRDPATGDKVGFTGNPFFDICCPQCNYWLTWGGGGCNTGLEYTGHDEARRFTGAVDTEGSNLWNWQDANGDSPATSWPTGAISIAGELLSYRQNAPALIPFTSVALEPGSKLAISLTTETLTVDDAIIEAFPYMGIYGPGPWNCANSGDSAVRITATGTATFTDGGENQAHWGSFDFFPGDFGDTTAGITGNCVFESGSKNVGTIRGNCTFSDDASNDGKVAGDCTFADTAANTGSIWGTCTFSGDSVNTGTVEGDATFTGNARNEGTVTGTATFTDDACNDGGTAGTFDPDPPPAC